MKAAGWRTPPHAAVLALGILTGTAQAQSSVTLYGVVDMNIEFVNNVSSTGATIPRGTPENRISMVSGGIGGSRWGLRGVEDLGSGLKGLFVLESGFTADDGRQAFGRLFGRQAFIGLESGYGKFTFGRQYNAVFDVFANFQASAYQPQYEPAGVFLGRYFRQDNTIKYSGKFGPLTAVAHWSFGVDSTNPATTGETPGNFRSGTAWGTAASYVAGPIGLALGYDEVRPSMTAGGSPGKEQKASMAIHYEADKLDIMAGYRWGSNKNPAGAQIVRDNYYWIGATYTFTPAFRTTLAYYYDDVKTLAAGNGAILAVKNPWQVLLSTQYFLSKRTSLYLATAYSKNAALNIANPVGSTTSTLGSGKDSQVGVALGMRHIF